jgi:hypothetical protein
MQEMSDPARALDRARETWQKHGRSEKWIQQRMNGQETRNKLTDYWANHEVRKGEEYAILTNVIHQEWSGVTVKDHKAIKGLKSQNLRDHMSEGRIDLHRSGGTLHAPDCRDKCSHRLRRKQGRRKDRRQDRKARTTGARSQNRQESRDWRKLPAA